MTSDIRQYIRDHTDAGACAYYHYQGNHDSSLCPVAPGYCALIGYVTGLLREAERKAAAAQAVPQVVATPPFVTGQMWQGQEYRGPYSVAGSGGNGGSAAPAAGNDSAG